MKRSTDRILVTHTVSLPRPTALIDLVLAQDKGGAIDSVTFEAEVAKAVNEVVAQHAGPPASEVRRSCWWNRDAVRPPSDRLWG
jgi:hypothetical protein